MLEYATLRIIWWLLIGILIAGYAILDGFDFGSAAISTTVAYNDKERRVVLNSVGPVWESNQIWFVLGAGAIFAAWPFVYAVSFSGLYEVMMLVLATLILRPVCLKYRSKIKSHSWRAFWDWLFCLCGLLTCFAFGILIGNVLIGIPFNLSAGMRASFTGDFWHLFHFFPIICGIGSVAMLTMHAGAFLGVRTTGAVRERSIKTLRTMGLLFIVTYVLGAIWLIFEVKGYHLNGPINVNGVSSPPGKPVAHAVGLWLTNYWDHLGWIAVPLVALAATIFSMISARWMQSRLALVSSSLSIAMVIGSLGIAMFPFIFPSSTHPATSLLVWDASASQLSLTYMTIATVIFLPIIIAYVTWLYYIMRGKVTDQFLKENDSAY